MRRLATAAFATAASAVLLAGCGGNKKEVEPQVRDMLRDFALAVVEKDDPRVNTYVLPQAGQTGNPIGAKDLDTPEGKAKIVEGNRRWCRSTFKEAGILEEKDVETFMSALEVFVSDVKNAEARFEIAAEGRRQAEVVSLRVTKTDQGWRIYDYSRDMKRR